MVVVEAPSPAGRSEKGYAVTFAVRRKKVDDVIAINFEAVNDDVERSHSRLKVIVLCEPHGCVRTKVIGTDVVRVHVYRAAAPSRRSPQRDDSDEIAARRPGE